MTHCPFCGTKLQQPPDLSQLAVLPNQRLKRRLLDALLAAYPRGLSTEQLMDKMFWDDPDGGPESNTIAVRVSKLRPDLEPLGWTITHARANYGIYQLKRIQP